MAQKLRSYDISANLTDASLRLVSSIKSSMDSTVNQLAIAGIIGKNASIAIFSTKVNHDNAQRNAQQFD